MRLALAGFAVLLACAKGPPPSGARPLQVGDAAPTARVKAHDGREVSLADFRGQKVLLWFYPAADTPG